MCNDYLSILGMVAIILFAVVLIGGGIVFICEMIDVFGRVKKLEELEKDLMHKEGETVTAINNQISNITSRLSHLEKLEKEVLVHAEGLVITAIHKGLEEIKDRLSKVEKRKGK